jgi:hypothetical protein
MKNAFSCPPKSIFGNGSVADVELACPELVEVVEVVESVDDATPNV